MPNYILYDERRKTVLVGFEAVAYEGAKREATHYFPDIPPHLYVLDGEGNETYVGSQRNRKWNYHPFDNDDNEWRKFSETKRGHAHKRCSGRTKRGLNYLAR